MIIIDLTVALSTDNCACNETWFYFVLFWVWFVVSALLFLLTRSIVLWFNSRSYKILLNPNPTIMILRHIKNVAFLFCEVFALSQFRSTTENRKSQKQKTENPGSYGSWPARNAHFLCFSMLFGDSRLTVWKPYEWPDQRLGRCQPFVDSLAEPLVFAMVFKGPPGGFLMSDMAPGGWGEGSYGSWPARNAHFPLFFHAFWRFPANHMKPYETIWTRSGPPFARNATISTSFDTFPEGRRKAPGARTKWMIHCCYAQHLCTHVRPE